MTAEQDNNSLEMLLISNPDLSVRREADASLVAELNDNGFLELVTISIYERPDQQDVLVIKLVATNRHYDVNRREGLLEGESDFEITDEPAPNIYEMYIDQFGYSANSMESRVLFTPAMLKNTFIKGRKSADIFSAALTQKQAGKNPFIVHSDRIADYSIDQTDNGQLQRMLAIFEAASPLFDLD